MNALTSLDEARAVHSAGAKDRIAAIRRMAEAGESLQTIASQLGIRRESVATRLKRHGEIELLSALRARCEPKVRKLTAIDVVRMREQYAQGGVSQAALAEDFGVSQATVSEIIRGDIWTSAAGDIQTERRYRGYKVARHAGAS